MDLGEGLLSPAYGRYKSDDQRSLSSISSLTSRSIATTRMAVLHRAMRQQQQQEEQQVRESGDTLGLNAELWSVSMRVNDVDETAHFIDTEGEMCM